MIGTEIEQLIRLMAQLPGLGQRSARRAVLHLLKKRETHLAPLISALTLVQENVQTCSICGNLDVTPICSLCQDTRRDDNVICVVQDVADLWALERTGGFTGRYHVLGGLLSALDGISPEDIGMASLLDRVEQNQVAEVILALPVTVDGQTTGHYIADALRAANIKVSGLAHGVPVGGELDYLDEGTIKNALSARKSLY